MKSFSLLLLAVSPSLIPVNAGPNSRDVRSTAADIQDGQTGVLMVLPPRQTGTGTKRVPDADHPFIAPGPNDMRGPAMNTLANHGYISRNGITTFEEIVLGSAEAFNTDRDLSSGLAALNMLTRGNPFVNKLSIGGISPLVPPLPGKIDGPETQGIAAHGRVEGDASMTRSDVHIGDNRNFNQTLWDEDLAQLAKFGDDGPDGPATVFNLQTLIEMKRQNLESDQVLDPEFALTIRRWNAALRTTKLATKRIISSFFMNQTFPENWNRAAAPAFGSPVPAQIEAALPQWVPGHNDENGVFVADPGAPAPFNSSLGCAVYWDTLVHAVPATLANVTGIFKQNVDLLNGILFNASGCAAPLAPAGPTNV
ncbi:Chloroperoxidase [Mycena polygramma]|nr:Chloroperoxidase [Mycena polygramma]